MSKTLLGEVNPDELFDTTIDPENRTILQINYENEIEAKMVLEDLFGNNPENRRKMYEEEYTI